ncbi:hypothetical protein A4X13_0g3017 [Tilletia indica]|uniref:Uncharacterized protein n=1 Tax=Tilletia indica TaxID=43049 RepID=A0A177TGE2_9BASI|nr:hypothetical protein A4X13_0g3017 [Tilletia indica]
MVLSALLLMTFSVRSFLARAWRPLLPRLKRLLATTPFLTADYPDIDLPPSQLSTAATVPPSTHLPSPPFPLWSPFSSHSAPDDPFCISSISNLTIVTLNCGRGGLRARLREFAPAARSILSTADIICLQECHLRSPILPDEPDLLRAFLNYAQPPSFTALLTRDTGIIIRPASLLVEAFDYGSQWSYIQVSLPPASAPAGYPFPPPILLSIFSIHGPFKLPQWAPIHSAVLRLHPDPSRPCIIGADWNSVPDPILDASNARPTGTPWSIPHAFLLPLRLEDSFRVLHPADPGWTYFRISRTPSGPVLTSARRLDSTFLSSSLISHLRSAYTVHSSSDHRALVVHLGPPSPPAPGRGPDLSSWPLTWALHPGLWRSPKFCAEVRSFAENYSPTHDLRTISAIQAWKLFALSAHTHLHQLSLTHGSTQRFLIDQLSSIAASLDAADCRSPSDMTILPSLLHLYRSALAALDLSLTLPFSSRLAAAELRLSSWLASSSSSPRSTPLPTLIHAGRAHESSDEKLAAIHAYFSDLYTPPPLPLTFETDCAYLLHHLVCSLPAPLAAQLAVPFTIDEVAAALKLANHRASSGPDGLPYRVWLELFPVAGPLLADLANALGAGEPIEVSARSVILPKSGDLSCLGNYRPISISDSFIRTLARMLSARLLSAADSLLPWSQAAFLPGRRTTLVSGILQGITELTVSGSPDGPSAFIVISLDQRKAYDRVRHEWMFACLRRLGLPNLLLFLLAALYSNASTRFSTAEGITDLIFFLAGVLQGDPSSCIIYNLTLQPFLDLLRAWGVGIMVPGLGILTSLAFADDVLLFIEASPKGLQQWHAIQCALHLYQRVSNAQINIGKSSFWLVGTASPANVPSTLALMSSLASFGLMCKNDLPFLIHLGHPIALSPGPPLDAIVSRLAAIRARALCFPTIGVCLLTRVQKAKQFLTSRLWHSISLGALPAHFSSLYFDALAPYLFAPTSAYVSRLDLVRPRSLGGLGLLDPDLMAIALSISFLRRYLLDDGPAGTWLRHGLTAVLRDRYSAPPAILLARCGPAFTNLQHGDTRADGLFGRLLHALARVDLGISTTWTSLPGPALVTLPWLSAFPRHGLADQTLTSYIRSGWLTWGDLLWMGPFPLDQPLSPPQLGLPPSASVAANARLLPYARRLPGAVPSLPWAAMFASLPSSVSRNLESLCTSHPAPFCLPGPLSPSVLRNRPAHHSWLPLLQDPLAAAFPWHLLTISGTPLSAVTPASVRRAMSPQEPRTPGWTFDRPTPDNFWARVWMELEDSPLLLDVRSSCLLVLGRNLWTYRAGPCPVGCAASDSPTHGICTCPEAVRVWMACLPLLHAMGVASPTPFTPFGIVGAWQDTHILRPRLVLWRNAVLATLHSVRLVAGRDARPSRATPDFRHCSNVDVLSQATAVVISSLSAAWDRTPQSSRASVSRFQGRWVVGSRLLRITGGTLEALPLNDASPWALASATVPTNTDP